MKKTKDDMINETMKEASLGPIALFYTLGLEDHIMVRIRNQENDDVFELTLKKLVVKTSEQWLAEEPNLTILDPDGWDRENYEYSFFKEKITKQEFNNRLLYSTCTITKE